MPLRLAPSAAALAALLASAGALGNGRFPNAQHVWRSPADGTMVMRATWGFSFLAPGRGSHWSCEDALGYGGEFDPAFVIDQQGGVWLGLYDGLARVAPDRCGITRVPALTGANVVDLDASPDGRSLVAVDNTPFTSGGAPIVARIWRSDDGGARWTQTRATLDDALVDTIEMSRSDVRRLYVTAREARRDGVRVLRSDDGGDTLASLDAPWARDAEAAFVAGVAPGDPDRVFVRVRLTPAAAGGAIDASALYRSDDGGRSWRLVRRTVGPMLGFALHDDGRTVWVGGPDPRDGLARSTDGGDTWELLPYAPVRCLRWTGGALYACLDAARRPDAALARSDDLGATFASAIDVCDLTPGLGCAGGADPAATCAALLPSTRRLLGCGRDAGAPRDASLRDDADNAQAAVSATPRGCAAAPGISARGSALGVIALALVHSRRRRAHPGRRRSHPLVPSTAP